MLTVMDQSNPTIIFNPSTSTYEIIYDGQILTATVTSSPSIITYWIEEITSQYDDKPAPATVGFGIKWQSPPQKLRSSSKRNRSKKPATLQFCIGGKCLIIQLCHVGVIPEALKRFLLNPNFTFSAVKGGSKMTKLEKMHGLQCSRVCDRVLAKKASRILGLGRSNEFCLGKRIKKPKHVRISNWEVKDLSEEQILYASLDACASLYNANPLRFMFPMSSGDWTRQSFLTYASFEMCG